MKYLFLALAALASAGRAALAEPGPYGVCAHVSRPGECETRGDVFRLMKAAGIDWCRTDFDWKYVEPQEGRWTFEHLDGLLDDAARHGVTILPILDYEVPWVPVPWRDDMSLGRWRDYVRRVVSHCRGRCPVWEVWNEQNMPPVGSHPVPSPEDYVKLLKAACEEIRAVDPRARVAVGGYAGVPLSYIEGVYKAGGRPFFDIMNVHPYQWTDRAEGQFEDEFMRLRALMARYGDTGKPVWATEIGLMPAETTMRVRGLLKSTLELVDARKPWRILVTERSKTHIDVLWTVLAKEPLPQGATLRSCTFEQLEAQLAAGGVDAVVFPFSEEYPADALDAVHAFVKAGGTVVDFGGMPMFKPVYWKKTGGPTVGGSMSAKADRLRFRFDDEYFYSDPRIPLRYDAVETALFASRPHGGVPPFNVKRMRSWGEARSIRPVGLRAADSFRPLMTCTTNGYTCTPIAWIKYDSDLKGNLLLSGYREKIVARTDELWQGKGCARQLNQAYAMGYEKLFWYEFQTYSGFGIVRRGTFEPRPAFNAYRTFVEMRPAGSVRMEGAWRFASDDVYCPVWLRPDGARAGAAWSVSGKGMAPAVARGARLYVDWKGVPLPALPDPLPDTPVYFVHRAPGQDGGKTGPNGLPPSP